MTAHQAPPSLGFSRQEHWSGLPFPSPMHESESEVTQSCMTLSDPMDCSLPASSIHGIFQASTGVGCHCSNWLGKANSFGPHTVLPNMLFNAFMNTFYACFYPSLGFPRGSEVKESACNAGDGGFKLWIGKILCRRAWQPTPVFLPGESHGQRSLAGYSL